MIRAFVVGTLALFGLSGAATAMPMSFNFSQVGFSGASVTGSFTAEDLDLDGQIASFTGEVSAFSMSFSGNSIVSAFSLGFGDLFGLVYDLDGDIGDGLMLGIEGIGADGPSGLYNAGPGPFAVCGVGVDCAVVSDGSADDFSQELVFVTASSVPEPASMLLLGSGLVGLVGIAGVRRNA